MNEHGGRDDSVWSFDFECLPEANCFLNDGFFEREDVRKRYEVFDSRNFLFGSLVPS